MNYKEEFERLLFVSEQALGGIDLENRTVPGLAGVQILKEAVSYYQSLQQNVVPDATDSRFNYTAHCQRNYYGF